MRRTHKNSAGFARPDDVIGILALARDEAEIFLPAHRRADTRRAHGGLPPVEFLILFGGLTRAALGHGFRSSGDRFDDVVIAGATADVAVELLADGVLVEIVAAAARDVGRPPDHSRR